mgnify:CR=1 FL=1
MCIERAKFVLEVLGLSSDSYKRSAAIGTEAAIAAQGVSDRYDELKSCCGFEEAEQISKIEFLADVLHGLDPGEGWTLASTPPSDDLLGEEDWDMFWCFIPSRKEKASRYQVRAYHKKSGWNEEGITHYKPLFQDSD